jgi:hypothetical protein
MAVGVSKLGLGSFVRFFIFARWFFAVAGSFCLGTDLFARICIGENRIPRGGRALRRVERKVVWNQG